MAAEDAGPRSSLREDALAVLDAAIRAVDPYQAILANLALEGNSLRIGGRIYRLAEIDRILVVGAGKAGTPMAAAAYEVLGDAATGGLITGGAVNVKHGHTSAAGGWRLRFGRGGEPAETKRQARTGPIEIVEAGHPVPDQAGLAGARRIAHLLTGLTERDPRHSADLRRGVGPLAAAGRRRQPRRLPEAQRPVIEVRGRHCRDQHGPETLFGAPGRAACAPGSPGTRGRADSLRRGGLPSRRDRFRPDRWGPQHLRRCLGRARTVCARGTGPGGRSPAHPARPGGPNPRYTQAGRPVVRAGHEHGRR